jgi:hypothetical protein
MIQNDHGSKSLSARLETHYERVIGVLEVQQDLGHDLFNILILFIAALSARTPGSINHRQAFIDDLERIHRMVVSGNALAEADADRLFTDSDEEGRRLIPEWTQAYAEVVARDGFVIVNQSDMKSSRPIGQSLIYFFISMSILSLHFHSSFMRL